MKKNKSVGNIYFNIITVVCLVLCMFIMLAARAQQPQSADTRTQLENQRKEILQQISETETELTQLRATKKVTINQLKVLQDKLNERKRLIDNINDEVRYINSMIEAYSNQIAGLKRKLERYKQMYTKSIRYSYMSRNTYSLLAYLCSSQDFNDAVRRMKYLRLMRAVRRQQADQIRATHAQLYHKIDLLNAEKSSKDKLLADLTGQNVVLATETHEADTAYKSLAGKEKELQAELLDKKKSAKRIDDAIQNIIKQEMQHSEENATGKKVKKDTEEDNSDEEVPKPKPKFDEIPAISKSELELARNFEKNKGKLTWPVDKGNISCHFGKYSIKNIDYFNNGVDIHTVTYGIVCSVFEGTVSSVVEMDGKVIIIVQHGNYFTVYNNLLRAMILKGQHVAAKQPLGLVANNEDGFPTLNFQIWKSAGSKHETTMLNPEQWMAKARK